MQTTVLARPEDGRYCHKARFLFVFHMEGVGSRVVSLLIVTCISSHLPLVYLRHTGSLSERHSHDVYKYLYPHPDTFASSDTLLPSISLTSTPTMPLLDLPAELRNQIWSYALVSKKPIKVPQKLTPKTPLHPGLLSVNRQVRAECTPIYYGENTFLRLPRLTRPDRALQRRLRPAPRPARLAHRHRRRQGAADP